MNVRLPSIYAITDRMVSGISDPSVIAERLFRVGVRAIQVREKNPQDADLLAGVERTRALAEPVGARVLVDDRVDIARMAGVGVHLGHQDLSAGDARKLLGPDAIVGVSTHDRAAARAAFDDPSCDYVAFGPVFDSGSKPGGEARGVEALADVAKGKTKPLVAIGGITPERLDAVLDAQADSAAMIGGLLAGGALEDNARRALDRVRRRLKVGRVYLVGFMGSGKTAIGRRVAERLEVPFVDLDAEIERTSGLTVRALFESLGEAVFRERESLFLAATESLPSAVVATGGGCYVRPENRVRIRRLGKAIFLDVPFEQLLPRLVGKTDRPLFQAPEQAQRLFIEREPFYRMDSISVALSAGSIEEGADRILCALFDELESIRL